MHRCRCSTRALEGFIEDFAGISLRQQRAQRFFQHYRSFGTRSSARQLQTTVVGDNADDAFIPFDSESAKRKREDLRREARGRGVERQEENVTSEVQEDGDEEWHAEVEITAPETISSDVKEHTVDTVSLRTLHADQEAHAAMAVPVLDLPAISQHMPLAKEEEALAPLSREERRRLRKLRRIKEGKHALGRLQNGVKPEDTDQDEVGDVLGKIDKLVGPSMMTEREKLSDSASPEKNSEKARTTETPSKERKAKAEKDAPKNGKDTTSKPEKPKKERWMVDKDVLKRKFGEAGWQPRKRLSPDTLEGIRALHASDPATYSTATLASHFQITPEAIRRILKSKWQPSAEDAEKRMQRWERRGLKKWEEMAAQGMKPPRKWREMGAGNPGLERSMTDSGLRKTKRERSWDTAVDAAERLPMEGSFADRIL